MNFVKTKDGTGIHYEDIGQGQPLVLIHGWPLSLKMWEYQLNVLPQHGVRCIAYDRRGFGLSDQPWGGYDYDTLADDLATLLETLDLQNVGLVGFSMGGGEVARYMSRHKGRRVRSVLLLGSVTPYLLKTSDNPKGVDQSVFDGILKGLSEDRPGFLSEFAKGFFGAGLISSPVSNAFLSAYVEDAMRAAGHATLACVRSWSTTDFRPDLKAFSTHSLIIHGEKDATVPIDLTAREAHKLINGSELRVYDGAPHGLYYTDREKLNADLLHFAGVR